MFRLLLNSFLFVFLFFPANSFSSEVKNDSSSLLAASYHIEKLFDNYDKVHRPGDSKGPVVVHVGIVINSFGQFNAVKMEYNLNMMLFQRWKDPRLVYTDYNESVNLNYLYEKLWVPDTFFPKSVEAHMHKVTVPNYLVWLSPQGEVKYSMKMTVTLSCILDLRHFPMDVQVCPVEISSYGYSKNDIILKWTFRQNESRPEGGKQFNKNVLLDDNINLNEFDIDDIVTSDDHTCIASSPCIAAKFHLKRNLAYYLISIYFPTILIIVISWLSFLIDFTSAPARISLGLLSVLTLITQSSLVIQSMPKISYIKAIDIWLFTCLAFVIISLLEFALINSLCRESTNPLFSATVRLAHQMASRITNRRMSNSNAQVESQPVEPVEEEPKRTRLFTNVYFPKETGYKIDSYCFIVYPILFAAFNIGYWTYYTQNIHD